MDEVVVQVPWAARPVEHRDRSVAELPSSQAVSAGGLGRLGVSGFAASDGVSELTSSRRLLPDGCCSTAAFLPKIAFDGLGRAGAIRFGNLPSE